MWETKGVGGCKTVSRVCNGPLAIWGMSLGSHKEASSIHKIKRCLIVDITQAKIFNHRLSCGHQVVECAFGVCTAKWRALLSSILSDVENAIQVVLACCILHNFLIGKERVSSEPAPPNPEQHMFMDLVPLFKLRALKIGLLFSHFPRQSNGLARLIYVVKFV